ncbi:hypothetical protein H6G54_16585 [Anabaena cylindrica FACHB-243]|uniref:Flagellar assembly protein H n=1 Tax=Anabaena cylindrica (strain ATCC 27899 / PCC 7122) TaxID=272123 RepID=K9ZGX5_ANACC|nr:MULTISPECIES: hypothetical protein [Anabaena]AFZ57802.1 hypothetical protein Anacy_2346 [Anabaena cylindrica PCC 7122]MBD2419288.1 hypothetical protein [Anabaena cylindrica FACHB-243]MBY5281356.1 hypothetical protein [Anabaena sp. CCAP 1446/1C]MBY5308390.1 hypothetical protein [Anabaena sp. CCAP 1446/1C]MCM2408110.1 hypothetical protein [Anabaena sp. CCAP 1446/1C]
MTRQPHDQFAKEYLQELLTSLGNAETGKDVKSEVREIDVWFVPNNSNPSDKLELELLAKMAVTSCLFEPFRNAPSEIEIRSCLLKLYTVHSDLLRQAKREKRSISEGQLPYLWILTPSCSVRMLNGFSAQLQNSPSWGEGVYFLPEFLKTAIVAINQLPTSPDTLWLRVLGKGKTQKQAVEELVKLSEDTEKWDHLLEILASWRKNIEVTDNVNDEERELIMNLSPAYLKQREEWRQEGLQAGRQEGRQEGSLDGQRLMVVSLLTGRFGAIDEKLSAIITPIMELSLPERTDLLLNLSNISREELLARFGS